MQQMPKYYIVEAKALPEIFLKVAKAKWLLETGAVRTVNDAAKQVDISRSAFYKYRDSIFPLHDLLSGRVLTFQILLHHVAGCLSSILSIFANYGANILTINQSIPTGGCASVTISAETTHLTIEVEEFLRILSRTDGVCKAELLAG
ncbi:MAG: ACT domain-containing protein [Oscillospiraceae bacterium]|nr:ACT domain-containing protein [Oscillospiraceae bacterium]